MVSASHCRPGAVTAGMERPALDKRAGKMKGSPALPIAGLAVCLRPEIIAFDVHVVLLCVPLATGSDKFRAVALCAGCGLDFGQKKPENKFSRFQVCGWYSIDVGGQIFVRVQIPDKTHFSRGLFSSSLTYSALTYSALKHGSSIANKILFV